MHKAPLVDINAAGLTHEQIQAGVTLNLYSKYEMTPQGWVILVNPETESVDAVVAYITGAPDAVSIDPTICALCETYLNLKARYEAIPLPPAMGADPWETYRAHARALLDAAELALSAGGGPV